MNHWLRLYNDVINDPKVLKLPEASRWHWVAMLCIASKYDGEIPSLGDVALLLRMPEHKAGAVLATLAKAGLLDKTETGFRPHNWEGRQYKSDVSTERVKRFRNGKRNVSETPPDTEQIQIQIEPEANASGADAPIDHRKRLFDEGLPKLAGMTGKGPDSCRSFVGKCLKAADDDAVVVLGLIEDAERNRVADPTAWIAARLKATGPPSSAKPLTEFQRKQAETNDVRAQLRNFASGGAVSGSSARVLPIDSRERSEAVRDGNGAVVE